MIAATLIAIAFSGALLMLLGARDPKRLRNARHGGGKVVKSPLTPAVRHACGWLSLAPGVALGLLGEWWAFLIWLGAITAIGWTIALATGYSAAAICARNSS
jgi:hypothetical protein